MATPDERGVESADVSGEVARYALELDYQIFEAAVWGQHAADVDLTFPVTSEAGLAPLFERAVGSAMSIGERTATMGPAEVPIPASFFPIQDLQDLVRKAWAFIRLQHDLLGDPPSHKWP